jgi:hypothetical protein
MAVNPTRLRGGQRIQQRRMTKVSLQWNTPLPVFDASASVAEPIAVNA